MTMLTHHGKPKLPIICGPTAVGKTALAIEIAEYFDGEIVSADSRQVYKEMDIGTAKPSQAEQARVTHHLIDVVSPNEDFNAARFVELASLDIEGIRSRDHHPLLVGGTGLYIRALTEGLLDAPGADDQLRERLRSQAEKEGNQVLYRTLQEVDPVAAERLHPNDRVRIIRALEVYELTGRPLSEIQQEHGFGECHYQLLKIGLQLDRQQLFARIDQRAKAMFDGGLVDETRGLLEAGYAPQLKTMQTIGYRQAIAVLNGTMSRNDAINDLQRTTRRYAKQQLTWFRQDKSIIWVDSCTDFVTIRKLIENFYGS
jgi:tRNA dimethylallyltransferase